MCVAIILIYNGARGGDMAEAVRFCLVLIVVAVPIALPTVLSVTMAVGAHTLSKRNAVCSRLTAVEELSAVDVLCCDKTGTLTKNELTVEVPVALHRHSPSDVILYAALCSNANNPDAIDSCLIRAMIAEPDLVKRSQNFEHTALRPFNPVVKRMEATLIERATGKVMHVAKGLVSRTTKGRRLVAFASAATACLGSCGTRSAAGCFTCSSVSALLSRASRYFVIVVAVACTAPLKPCSAC